MDLIVRKINGYTKEYFNGKEWVSYTYDQPIYVLEKMGE